MTRQYLVTERAHFMCPNMHFAIMAEIKGYYHKESVHKVLIKQAMAHPFLRSVILQDNDTDKLYYSIEEDSRIYFEEIADGRTYTDIMNDIAQHEWNVFCNGLLKVYAFSDEENTKLLFVAHHLLCDGRGLLQLISEFADAYVRGIEPVYSEEHLIAGYEDLPKGAKLPWMSKMLVASANKNWKKENQSVSYELYAKVSDDYGRTHRNSYEENVICDSRLQSMIDLCHENDFSVNDLLSAQICKQYDVKKLIIAADIRSELPSYQEGSLGNYATAFSIMPKCKGSVTDRAKEIKRLSSSVLSSPSKKMMVLTCYMEMEPTLLDAAAVSALGGLESKAGKFVGATMFSLHKPASYSITNLGRINSESIQKLMFIPPSSAAAIMTMGVVTVNNTMITCCSRTITDEHCSK